VQRIKFSGSGRKFGGEIKVREWAVQDAKLETEALKCGHYLFSRIIQTAELITFIKKVKLSHNTHMEAQGERKHSSYSFTISALDGGEWSAYIELFIVNIYKVNILCIEVFYILINK
jgi:hypothetical protein